MATAPDYNAIYAQSLEQAKAAAQPAISALQAQNPLIQKGYDTTAGQIQGNQTADIGDTQTTLSREYGARGIPLSSGVFGQNLDKSTSKIRNYYTGQLNQAAQQRDTSLASLAQQLAGLESGYQQNAIQAAQGMYGQQYGAYNDQLNRDYQSAENEKQRQASVAASRAASSAFNPTIGQVSSAQTRQLAPIGVSEAVSNIKQYSKDQYVDQTEYSRAYNDFRNAGYSAQQAQQAMDAIFTQGGYKKYKW